LFIILKVFLLEICLETANYFIALPNQEVLYFSVPGFAKRNFFYYHRVRGSFDVLAIPLLNVFGHNTASLKRLFCIK